MIGETLLQPLYAFLILLITSVTGHAKVVLPADCQPLKQVEAAQTTQLQHQAHGSKHLQSQPDQLQSWFCLWDHDCGTGLVGSVRP